MSPKIIVILIAAAFAVLHVVLIQLVPAVDLSRRFGLSPEAFAVLRLTSPPLVALTWIIGTYAAMTLFASARSMHASEKLAYRRIAAGLLVLIAANVATSILRDTGSLNIARAGLFTAVTVLAHLTSALGLCAGSLVLWSGAGRLEATVTGPKSATWPAVAGAVVLVAQAAAYVALVFTNPIRTSAPPPQLATYFMPDALIAVFVVLPFLVSTLFAAWTIFRLSGFARNVVGDPYRRVARGFVAGLVLVIFGLQLYQSYLSIGTARFVQLGFGQAVLFVFLFSTTLAVGYAIVGVASKRLKRIEELMRKFSEPAEPSKPERPPITFKDFMKP